MDNPDNRSDLMKRIAALNRQPLANTPAERPACDDVRRKLREERQRRERAAALEPAPAVVLSRDVPAANPPKPTRYVPPDGPPVRLADAVSGIEVADERWGRALLVRTRGEDVAAHRRKPCLAFQEAVVAPDPCMPGCLTRLCRGAPAPDDLVFIDLETTGLTNCPVFLGGLMVWEDDELVIHQYLARDYSEEAAITARMVDLISARRVLVSFNGKSFDLPFLRTRAAATGVPFTCDPAHLDLLPVARRAWRHRLPDCKLQTLERWICGHVRDDDIPGAEVPDAYHAFVRTGNAADIVRILKHNALDLLTLAELLLKLPGDDRRERDGAEPSP